MTTDAAEEDSPNCGRYRDFFVPHGFLSMWVEWVRFGTRDALRLSMERDDY